MKDDDATINELSNMLFLSILLSIALFVFIVYRELKYEKEIRKIEMPNVREK